MAISVRAAARSLSAYSMEDRLLRMIDKKTEVAKKKAKVKKAATHVDISIKGITPNICIKKKATKASLKQMQAAK